MPEAEREQVHQERQPETSAAESSPPGQGEMEGETAVTEVMEKPKKLPEGSRSYELIFLVDAALPQEELDALIGKVRRYLEGEGGIIDNIRVSEVRRLAYEIKKRTHGIYVVFNFHILPSRVAGLDRMLRMEGQVLRHMIIHMRV